MVKNNTVGPYADERYSEFAGGDADYQNNREQLAIFWSGSDDGSGIAEYEYALGTTSEGQTPLIGPQLAQLQGIRLLD